MSLSPLARRRRGRAAAPGRFPPVLGPGPLPEALRGRLGSGQGHTLGDSLPVPRFDLGEVSIQPIIAANPRSWENEGVPGSARRRPGAPGTPRQAGSAAPRTPRPRRAGALPPPFRLRAGSCPAVLALNHGFFLCPCCEKCSENTAAKFLEGQTVAAELGTRAASSALPGVASGRRGDRLHPLLLPIGTLFSPRSIAIQHRSAYRRNFRTLPPLRAAAPVARPAGIPAGHHLRAAAGAGQLPAAGPAAALCRAPSSPPGSSPAPKFPPYPAVSAGARAGLSEPARPGQRKL